MLSHPPARRPIRAVTEMSITNLLWLAIGDFSMSREEWRDVVGYEGVYQVSSQGRVKRIAGGVGARSGHIIKDSKSERYSRVELSRYGCVRSYSVHRLVLEAFVGPCPNGHEANHKDGNRKNNRLENLEWVTASQNVRHSIDVLGAQRARGEDSYLSKLKENHVREIRQLLREGYTRQEIACRYGVTVPTIRSIAIGKTWKHMR